jgi:hypothetical protein
MIGPIGVDLDNTIVSYDDILYRVATELDLIGPEVSQGKKAVRDAIRQLPDGEIEWQKLQAEIYGPRMGEAQLIDGVADFFEECQSRSIFVYIISHKTKFANYDSTGTNLRLSALNWLESQGIFSTDDVGLSRERVFFESTRQAKIERIGMLGCTHFIDDLEETFLEEIFPPGVVKILFDPHELYAPRPGVTICSSWAEISSYLVDGAK